MGEMKATHLDDMSRYRCSCGERITECAFWRRVQTEMADRGISFDITAARTAFRDEGDSYVDMVLKPLHRGPVLEAIRDVGLALSPIWRRRMPIVQWRNAMLAKVLCDLTGARVVVDSSKTAVRLKYLLRNPGLNVKVIRLIRDGRGVALAYTKPDQYADATNPRLRGGGGGGDRAGERQTIAEAARQWRRSNEEAECLLGRLDRRRWMQVHYEDLCAFPRPTLREIFEFLSLDPADAVATRRFRKAAGHVIGNGMRLDEGSAVVADERWRTELTDADLTAFDAVAGGLNRRYGYD